MPQRCLNVLDHRHNAIDDLEVALGAAAATATATATGAAPSGCGKEAERELSARGGGAHVPCVGVL